MINENTSTTVRGYDLDPPTKDYAIHALSKFMNESEALSLGKMFVQIKE